MPLKVPNYRAVSELFRKKAAEPQPSGVPDRPTQKLDLPRDYAVPLPEQSSPHSFVPQLRKPPIQRSTMQRSTMPLSAPLYDNRLYHLTNGKVTRRDAISTALGEPRATDFIDKSTAYRQANPEIFEGVYDGGNIDRPIKVTKNYGLSDPDGEYWSGSYDKATNTVSPERIEVHSDSPFGTLIHELFHLDTSGSRPQDVEEPLKGMQEGKELGPFVQLLYNRFRPVGSRTGKDAKVITDRAYYPDGGGDRSEMGSQLGALRVHLEQLGIDTSNKEELRKALSTMADDPRIMHNFEAQRIHRALNDPSLSPQQRERGLDALVELMPGIAKADTTQYPYRKVASEPSSPLRGLTILSTISALLKGR